MDNLLQDIRFGFRMLMKKPGFTAVAVLTLALGIGANSAIFSVVNAILFRPLPFQDPDRLVMIWEKNPGLNLGVDELAVSTANFVDWKSQSQVFEQLAAFDSKSFNLTGVGEPDRVGGVRVSAAFFNLLGVKAMLGRTFLAEEDEPGKSKVVVISHGLWQRRFGSDPSIIGKTISLDGISYDVVGVMPPKFRFPQSSDMPVYYDFPQETSLWTPLAFTAEQITDRDSHDEVALGRLKPNVTLPQAQAEMNTIAGSLERQYPETNTGWGVSLVPLHKQLVGNIRSALLILVGAVGCVLLIACANVANLQLAKASSRHKEIAIRASLGAKRGRIISQLLTESLLLSLLGGVFGILLTYFGISLLLALSPDSIPRVKEVGIDIQVLAFTLAVSVLTGIIFGLAPALNISKPNLAEYLKDGGKGTSEGIRGSRIRSLLVVSEVVLALVLLIGAGLMIKSFLNLLEVKPGFDPRGVLTMKVSLPESKYPEAYQKAAFFQQVIERIKNVPGVQSVGAITQLPLSRSEEIGSFTVEGHPPLAAGELLLADRRAVSPDYFSTMRVPLEKGRLFTEQDRREAPKVIVISKMMADRIWPNEDPIGKRITFSDPSAGRWLSVVGVVGDVKHSTLDTEPRPQVYRPYPQNTWGTMHLVVRTASDPMTLTTAVRNEVWAVDRDQPVYSIQTMEQLLDESIFQRRFNMLLLGVFAVVALILAAVGIYSVMAYSVIQRTHEIGIRMALGAEQKDILKIVISQGMTLVLVGLAIGLVAAFVITRVMSSLLFGVSATDPITFVILSLLLAAIALFANYIPARKATKVSPIVALRHQ
ncbi:MAG TPA: ABC transporter permease [Blastocatellia bacterium]